MKKYNRLERISFVVENTIKTMIDINDQQLHIYTYRYNFWMEKLWSEIDNNLMTDIDNIKLSKFMNQIISNRIHRQQLM